MASKNKSTLERTPTEAKNFGYKQGNVTLKFSLRTDIKSELSDFLALLKAGVDDVQKEIEVRFPKGK